MAAVTPEIPDKAKEAMSKAAAANSIPELREAVADLVEAVQRLEIELARVQKKTGR